MDRRELAIGLGAALAGWPSGAQAIEWEGAAGGIENCAGLPCEWIAFSKQGDMTSPAPPTLLEDPTITDFIIVSHGWNTDQPGAQRFYGPLLQGVADAWSVGAAHKPANRRYAVLRVLWPSKQFGASSPANATISQRSRSAELDEATLRRIVEDYARFTGANAARLMDMAQAAIGSELRQPECAALLSEALGDLAAPRDQELTADLARYDAAGASALLQQLSAERRLRFADSIARRQGMAADARGRYRGLASGISSLLNSFTFFTMKARAGDVGRGLAGAVLAPLQASSAARIHMIGHSFGARVVTAAAHHAADPSKLRSLILLQGAFSHNALGRGGAFEGTHRKIAGPTLITHTHNDSAVTRWYAIASHASGDTSRTLGDAQDPFGAIGANGALGVAEDVVAPAPTCRTEPLVFTPGKVHNMNSGSCITDSRGLSAHMNVTNARIARIVAQALVS